MANKFFGCLKIIQQKLGIFNKNNTKREEFIYFAKNDYFLSDVELSFYKVLQQVIDYRTIICPKVSLKDLFCEKRKDGNKNTAYRSQIGRERIDFLLCTKDTFKLLCGIELYNTSNQRKDYIERNNFVEKVFESADLPLVRFPIKLSYTFNEITEKLSKVKGFFDVVPICKKCGSPTILHILTRGDSKGHLFYGCSNHPNCIRSWQGLAITLF